MENITLIKINELDELIEQHRSNGAKIERLWNRFVARGDKLSEDFESADFYCDNIHQVKDWTMKGLSGDCEIGQEYLAKIEDFQQTFDFNFYEELECRVQSLRIRVWDCRYGAIEGYRSLTRFL